MYRYSLFLDNDDHEFPKLSLDFANAINKDLRCRKLLLAQLEKFVNYVKSKEIIDCFGTEPKEVLFIKFRQQICEKITERERDVKGISVWLEKCTSRPLVHLRDVLMKLKDEGRLNKEGLTEVTEELKEQHEQMEELVSESIRSCSCAIDEVDAEFQTLRTDIWKWVVKRENSISELRHFAEKLDKETGHVERAKRAGAGIMAGGVALGVVLAPFTAGIGLVIAGGAGAITAAGATIGEFVTDKKLVKQRKKCLENDDTELIKNMATDFNMKSRLFFSYFPPDAIEVMPAANRMMKYFGRDFRMDIDCLENSVPKPNVKSKGNLAAGLAGTLAFPFPKALGFKRDAKETKTKDAESKYTTELEKASEELKKVKQKIIDIYYDGKFPVDK